MSTTDRPRRPARRRVPTALLAGVLLSGALAVSVSPSLATFTATLTHGTDTVTSGTLVMSETQSVGGSATCLSTTGGSVATNSASCTTINEYGGSLTLVPGGTSTSTVTITNAGTATASTFTLTPSACTQSGDVSGSAADLCSKLTLAVTKTISGTTTTVVTAGTTLAAFSSGGAISLPAVAAGGAVSFTFTVTLPVVGNAYEGLTASQPLTWQFSAGS